MSQKYRHELKYIVNQADAYVLARRLGHVLGRDGHAGGDGRYTVRSLYFDTPDDKALREKLEGFSRREKYRIRYYGDDPSYLRLEKKSKVEGVGTKRRASLSPEEVGRIVDGDFEFLGRSGDPLKVELYARMKGGLLAPKSIVTYTREAFSYVPGNVRVTIDSRLHGSSVPRDFLDPRRVGLPIDPGFAVLEVKYDSFFPDVVASALRVSSRQRVAYSKYAECRRYE